MEEIRTDLAFESRNFYLSRNNIKDLPETKIETEENEIYKINRVSISSDSAASKIGKKKGNYITIHSKHISSGLFTEDLSLVLAKELSSLIPKGKEKGLAFVAGLGNKSVTPDALGPEVLTMLIVTRHLSDEFPKDSSLSSLCALAPGVLGITGIESAEIFKAVAQKVKPDYVIAIDALASASPSHVGTTIQISDTGINPGSGVHNRRSALNEDSLGVPVIALGVPTVSDSKSVILNTFSPLIKEELIEEVLKKEESNLMVTPKNIDAIILRAAAILSRGINLSVHKGLQYNEITEYIS